MTLHYPETVLQPLRGTRVLLTLDQFLRDESGQDLIEYVLLAALIGLTAVTGVPALSGHIADAFDLLSSGVTNASIHH